MNPVKTLYEEFTVDFEATFFPRVHEYTEIVLGDRDIPRLNEFSKKWHDLVSTDTVREPHEIKKSNSEAYKIAMVNWLYYNSRPVYIKACRVRFGSAYGDFKYPMPVCWTPVISSSRKKRKAETEPVPESASQSGLPEAPAGKTPC